jgi:Protein of unknown function (DUF3592)
LNGFYAGILVHTNVLIMKEVIGYFFFGLFALAGLVSGGAGAYMMYNQYQIREAGVHTTGVVVAMNRSTKGATAPVVGYTDQAGAYQIYPSNFYSSGNSMSVGDSVSLYYMPQSPDSVVLEGEASFPVWLPFLFLFTHGGVGIGGIIWLERRRRLRIWLRDFGKVVEAKYTAMEPHRKNGYRLVCTWTDPYTGLPFEFKSDYMKQAKAQQYAQSGTIRVLIDPDNLKRYWVETD